MCRFQQNRAVGGSADSLLEEPRRRQSVRAPGLPKVSFPCFPDQSLRNAWTAGSQGRLPCGPLGRSVWLWLPLCHLSVFFTFLLFRTLWLLCPPRDDSGGWWHRLLPTHFLTAASSDSGSHVRPRTRTPGLRGPVGGAAVPRGRAGRHRRGGGRGHRPFSEPSSAQGFRPFSPAKPFAAGPARSPRKGDASPASAWRNASPPALRHIREGAFARQPRAWRVAGNPTFTVSLAPICGHTSATSRAPEGAWCRQRPGWEGHRPGDLWGGIWTHQLRRVLFVSIYLSFWLRGAEPRVGSGAQCGSATLLRRGRTGHS